MISIIVPIYNSAIYLDKCLLSLKNQTYTDIEVIMVDDGSSDESADICRSYEATDHRFKYVYQENSGVSAARNVGLRMANGDYVGFCDSDDWVEEDAYEIMRDIIIKNDADISILSFQLDPSVVFTQYIHGKTPLLYFDAETAILEMHDGKKFQGHLCNKLIKRELLTDLRLREDISICEDMVFMWMAFYRSRKVVFCDVPKYHYMMHPQSAMNAVLKDSFWSIQIAARQLLAYMNEYYPQHKCCAQKTIVKYNMIIAEKAALCRNLTKENYNRIKREVKQNYVSEVKKNIKRRQRLCIITFLLGRKFYTLFIRTLLKLKKAK